MGGTVLVGPTRCSCLKRTTVKASALVFANLKITDFHDSSTSSVQTFVACMFRESKVM